MTDKLWNIFFWVSGVFLYSLGVAMIPGGILLVAEIFDGLGTSYYDLLNKIGIWTYFPFLLSGILIKIIRDKNKSKTSGESGNLKEFGEIMIVIIVALVSMALIGRIIDRNSNQVKSRAYVYACPKEESPKCYELLADEIKCTYSSNEGCEEWETTIYFPNSGSSYLTCYSMSSGKLNCTDEQDQEWEMQESLKQVKTNEEMKADKEAEKIMEELLPK